MSEGPHPMAARSWLGDPASSAASTAGSSERAGEDSSMAATAQTRSALSTHAAALDHYGQGGERRRGAREE